MRGPSLAAGCAVLIGRRMVLLSFVVATDRCHRDARAKSAAHSRCSSAIGEDREFFAPSQRQCGNGAVSCARAPLRRNTAWQAVHSGSLAPAEKRQMDDNSLKFLEIGTGAERRALAIRAREGAAARTVLALGLQVGHEGHQGRGAGALGEASRPRLRPLRLFRPRQIRRRIHRRYDRALARRQSRGVRRLLPRAADCGRLVDGRLAGAAHGPRPARAGAKRARNGRRHGADRAGRRFYRGIDVETFQPGDQARAGREQACGRGRPRTRPSLISSPGN